MIIQSRRNFIIGLTSALAAPAIVRADSLMKVRAPKLMRLDDYCRLILRPILKEIDRYRYLYDGVE